MSVSQLAGYITGSAAVIGAIYTGVVWFTDRIATKDYHNDSMTAVVESLDEIKSDTTVARMVNALNARCELLHTGGDTSIVDEVIHKLGERYFKLEDREFPVGRCENGERIR